MGFSCLGNWGLFGSGIHAFTDCSEALGPVVDNIQTGYITESMADALPAYKRNYNGIFSVVEYNNPASSSGLSLLAVMHEENKGDQLAEFIKASSLSDAAARIASAASRRRTVSMTEAVCGPFTWVRVRGEGLVRDVIVDNEEDACPAVSTLH